MPDLIKFDLTGNGRNIKTVKNQWPNHKFKPFQLTPWSHPDFDEPPEEVLEYEDNQGLIQRGVPIFIGLADGNTTYNTRYLASTFSNVGTSITDIVSRGKIEIYFDAKVKH
jgi:hypothetical protein